MEVWGEWCWIRRPKFPLLDRGDERTAKTDPLSSSLRQNKKKKEPDPASKGNSNVLASGPIIRVLTVDCD